MQLQKEKIYSIFKDKITLEIIKLNNEIDVVCLDYIVYQQKNSLQYSFVSLMFN